MANYNTSRKIGKSKAEEVLAEFALGTPVPVMKLAQQLGIEIKLCSGTELSRVISKAKNTTSADTLAFFDKKARVFYLNRSNQGIARMRFTVAHELGHYFLHEELPDQARNTSSHHADIPDAEFSANYFASYLLIPDNELTNRLHLVEIMESADKVLRNFAKFFGVTPAAMKVRFELLARDNPELWEKYKLTDKFPEFTQQ